MSNGYHLGLDVGSATTKAVLIDVNGTIIAHTIRPSGGQLAQSATWAKQEALERTGINPEQILSIISTGYGRDIVEPKTKSITEITCHAKGAYALLSTVRFVIDIGGQDSKAILIDSNGQVQRFEMNDKCAAGTGRFLEVMARTLGIELEDMGQLALSSETTAKISSTCTVFAESEVVSLLAKGEPIPSVVSGLCKAVAERVLGLASRVGVTAPIMMTGGVAKNRGVVHWLSQLLNQPIHIPDEPQIVGALGAAMLGKEMYEKQTQIQMSNKEC